MTWEVSIQRNVPWNELEAKQRALMAEVHSNKSKAYLLISEPTPTFTFGRNSDPKELLWNSSMLEKHQVQVAPVNRGGKWTFHGPGQILIYPILHLPSWGYSSKSVRAFLQDFRLAILEGLRDLDCQPLREGEPFGIYVGNKKLVSFGLAFEKSVSSHGMALYLSDQSNYFSGITPCGVSDGSSTSLGEITPRPLPWDSVAMTLADRVKKRFSLRATQVL